MVKPGFFPGGSIGCEYAEVEIIYHSERSTRYCHKGRNMKKTDYHRKQILEVIRSAGDRGINSRVLIHTITPRYSARLRELRTQGYVFKTRRDRVGGSNLIRIWYEGYKTEQGIQKPEQNTKRWKFDNETGKAWQVNL